MSDKDVLAALGFESISEAEVNALRAKCDRLAVEAIGMKVAWEDVRVENEHMRAEWLAIQAENGRLLERYHRANNYAAELEAGNERLENLCAAKTKLNGELVQGFLDSKTESERLRAAANTYFDILERQQREALGDDATAIIEAMEQSSNGSRELAEAKRRLSALLGRAKEHA